MKSKAKAKASLGFPKTMLNEESDCFEGLLLVAANFPMPLLLDFPRLCFPVVKTEVFQEEGCLDHGPPCISHG